jgi:RecQ-mediated genome instability protein 1
MKTCRAIENEHSGVPDHTGITRFIRAVENALLHARWANIMEPGSGLPLFVGLKSMYITLDEPIVLELVHMAEVGVSAFALEKVRLEREQAIYTCFSKASSFGETLSLNELSRLEDSLPDYPRNTLKLYLTDGAVELEAVELRRIPGLDLGRSSMGLKVFARAF